MVHSLILLFLFSGEFVPQTCFQGRFGEEVGSGEFGVTIMAHSSDNDGTRQRSILRLSFIEVYYAGQAFRLGRYPVHFHMNGIMSESYAYGLAIHKTFNRAINIHGSHQVRIEWVVAYNVMGGALFLEDGIETKNYYGHVLVLFCKASSSLLNDDITPAGFWATNPDNTYEFCHAAGGTHFAFWFKMDEHPLGPSATSSVCPRHVPLLRFFGNVGHSQGWFGIWIFPDYYPRVGGACGWAETELAIFDNFFSWHNEKGIEFVNAGAIQIHNSLFVGNKKAGYEGKQLVGSDRRDEVKSPGIRNSVIVGKSTIADVQSTGHATKCALVLPYGDTFMVYDVTFHNFDDADQTALCFTKIDGTCSDQCGTYEYPVSGLVFNNVLNRLWFEWANQGRFQDKDGSLSGTANALIVAGDRSDIVCGSEMPGYKNTGLFVPALVCDGSWHFHRLAFNNISPASLAGKDFICENTNGQIRSPFMTHRLTHPDGWVVDLKSDETYYCYFDNAEDMTNISFSGQMNELRVRNSNVFYIFIIHFSELYS